MPSLTYPPKLHTMRDNWVMVHFSKFGQVTFRKKSCGFLASGFPKCLSISLQCKPWIVFFARLFWVRSIVLKFDSIALYYELYYLLMYTFTGINPKLEFGRYRYCTFWVVNDCENTRKGKSELTIITKSSWSSDRLLSTKHTLKIKTIKLRKM